MPENRIKVLIIDDDDIDRMMIKRALKLSGFNADIFTAVDIETGKALAAEDSFQYIFLDYSLPGNNGFDFLDYYKEINGTAPIIMVTSRGDENLAVEAMKKGAFDYIPKNMLTAESVSRIFRSSGKKVEVKEQSGLNVAVSNDENELTIAIESAPIIIFKINSEGVFTLFKGNGADEIIAGVGAVTGKSIYETGNTLPVQLKDYKDAIDGKTLSSSVQFNERFYEVHFITVKKNDDSNAEVSGIILNVTSAKKSEQELKSALQISEDAQKIKEQFLANMSHEIRTPIHGILNLSDILLKSELLPEQRKFLSAIKKSADNLLVIINDILDLSKINADKLTFENIRFNLRELVDMIIEMFKPRAAEKNISLLLNYADTLPEFITGDSVRLSQLMNNLISNAIKFTHEGRVTVDIFPAEKNEKQTLISFKVSDTGIGIPQHKLSGIFDSFTQAGNDITRMYGGTGLGLSICKSLVELQGGMITVESTLNEGSTFTFSLSYENTEAIATDDTKQLAEQTDFSDLKLKLLVVEDNDINRLVVNKMMSDWNFQIENASNGSTAIDMIEENEYDIVLMDIEMPGMNGYETVEHIRTKLTAAKKNIPVLAMTAHANTEEKEKCKKAGMNDYISKPFDSLELKEKLLSLHRTANTAKNYPALKEANERFTNLLFLRELSENNDTFFRDFIQLFLQNAPVSISDLETCLKKEDWEGVRQAAHKIKPSLSYLGMKNLHELAATIEENAKQKKDLQTIGKMIQAIAETCKIAYTELEQELKALHVN